MSLSGAVVVAVVAMVMVDRWWWRRWVCEIRQVFVFVICEEAGRGVNKEFGFGFWGLCILRGICKLNATVFI